MSDAEHALTKQVQAAKALRESLKLVVGDDVETLADMIEGETDLREAIGEVDKSIIEDELLVAGLGSMIDDLGKRRGRIEERIGRKRAAIEQAMQIGEVKRIELPTGTLTLKDVPPKVEIYEEANIPAKYWKAQDPRLDKAALGKDLKDIAAAVKAAEKANADLPEITEIPGARLGNGGITIQIRRS